MYYFSDEVLSPIINVDDFGAKFKPIMRRLIPLTNMKKHLSCLKGTRYVYVHYGHLIIGLNFPP